LISRLRRSSDVHLDVLVRVLALGLSACTYQGPPIDLDGQDVELTFLHTADWHSRLLPYELEVGEVDQRLGLDPTSGPFGGGRAGADATATGCLDGIVCTSMRSIQTVTLRGGH